MLFLHQIKVHKKLFFHQKLVTMLISFGNIKVITKIHRYINVYVHVLKDIYSIFHRQGI